MIQLFVSRTVTFKYIFLKYTTQQISRLRPMENQGKDVLRQMYKSGVRGTYFKTMIMKADPTKSRINEIAMIENEESDKIDQNTFRLNRKFNHKEDHYSVFKRTGFVYIQTQSFFSCIASRRKHYLELDNSKLRLTNNDTLVSFFDFNLLAADVVARGNYFQINVMNCDKSFYFEPVQKGSGIVNEWVDLISKIIRESDGKPNKYTYLAEVVPNFQKTEAVSNEEFQNKANSGDVLLFRSEHSAARMQQLFTNSQYDHVGIVLRNAKNELFVFESSSTDGVGLTPWRHMIKYEWYKSTEKICWRRLKNLPMNSDKIDIIEAFVAKTLGRGFQINIEKLFMFNSALKRSPDEEKSKTYFCSELVARLYKELGLLDESKSSTQYYPVDFSNKGQLKLKLDNVSLETQKIICFDGLNKKK